ncbi:c-type cytochrome [Aestuariivirga sp.]|uniref:c-type cytochrome n=1 Tax=Aestuariivirga sp. TaxID=2650926 RepID=UPI0025C12FD0|nr:c-type cytochrome [Aestuariivirga sp.]MCA3554480.1 c-type cytochrome [Aestuariivirga sp.]
MRIALPFLALAAFALPALAAGEAQMIAEGKRLAQINCTKCHNIEPAGASPLAESPPFREIAKNYDREELIDGFMDGLAVRHPLMPNWDVTQPQAEALTAFVMSLGTGQKPEESQAARGFDLLRANCARCHAIDASSMSPNGKAPPFRNVVRNYDPDALQEALAEGIVTGHNNMPEFAFEPDDVTAIIAYLDTLKSP